MSHHETKPVLTPRALREFAMTVGIAFLVLAALAAWRGRVVPPIVLAALGVTLVIAGLVAPVRLAPVYAAWMALALAISRVTTPLFMGIVYFVLLTPLGLVMRLFGHRALERGDGQGTQWVERPASARRSDLRRQF